MTRHAFICDAIRTPFGRYGGALAGVRADDLGAVPIAALMARNAQVDWQAVADVIYGCANQAGEDNRNVARMSALLAGLPVEVPGSTVNRLCGSGLDALGTAARAIKSGEAGLMIAGGVESMSRAPFVMAKAESAFSRSAKIEDTTIGWRFVNQLMKAQLRRRLHARDGRERGHRLRHRARRAGPHGAGLATEGAGRAEAAVCSMPRSCRCTSRRRRASADRRQPRRTPARHHAGGAGQAQGRGAARRQRDRRQRLAA